MGSIGQLLMGLFGNYKKEEEHAELINILGGLASLRFNIRSENHISIPLALEAPLLKSSLAI